MFIHGILGTPRHFDFLLELVPDDCTVVNLHLKGHGGSVRDFSSASMAAWKKQVHNAVEELLSQGKELFIAAHSMGTLFAAEEAVHNPSIKLFLMNMPLKIYIRPRLINTSWKIFIGKIDPNDKWMAAAKNAYGIDKDRNIFHYLGWIPRYLELFSEISRVNKLIDKLSVPCTVFFSANDEMVSLKSQKKLRKKPHIKVCILERSGHYYYSETDRSVMRREFEELVRKINY